MTLRDLVLDSAKPGVVPAFGFEEDIEFLDEEITFQMSFDDIEIYRIEAKDSFVEVYRGYYRGCDVYTVSSRVTLIDSVPDRNDLVEDEFITSVLQARWLCDAL